MKKCILFFAAIFTAAFTTQAQSGCEGYMLVEKGITLEYTDYDAKDVITGSRSSTITNLTTNGNVLSVTIHSISKKCISLSVNVRSLFFGQRIPNQLFLIFIYWMKWVFIITFK